PITDADVLVPLSQDELRVKIFAIFKHQSQKDTAPFPGGHDDREFWQRVEAATSKRRRGRTAWGCPSISPWRRTWWTVTAPRDAEARAASRRLLATSERELQRIVLDMHDGPVQDIFAALSQLQVLDRSLAADPTAQQRAGQAVRLLERALG